MKRFAVILVAMLAVRGALADDPFPVRRELLPPGSVRAPAGQDALVHLTRDEFEKRITAAAAALKGRDMPRLVAARYTARLEGTNLVGQARWTIRHTATSPTLLRLSPWGPAWRSASWSDGDAVVAGALAEGDDLQLLVAKSGDRDLVVDWSLRGRETPSGILFDLRVPTCPTAQWEFDLAGADAYWPGDSATPQPSAAPDGRWIVRSASGTRLVVRPRTKAVLPARYLMRTDSRIGVSPGLAEVGIDLTLDFVRDRCEGSSVVIDPALDVTSISGDSLVGWNQVGESTSVQLRFTGAQSHVSLRIAGRTPLTSGRAWVMPYVRPVGGTAIGETIVIAVAPGVELDEWRDGALDLVGQQRLPNGDVELKLTTPVFRSGAGRPSCRPVFAKPFYDVSQHLRWRIEPHGQTLTADVTWRPFIGPVTQATLDLPPEWEVESVEGVGGDAPTWKAREATSRPTLSLEWTSADLAPRRAVVRMRTKSAHAPGGLPVPDLFPTEARSRQATLDTWVSPLFEAELAPGSSLISAMIPGGPDAPSARWRARSSPIAGRLVLTKRPAPFGVRGEGTIVRNGNSYAVEHRLRVSPTSDPMLGLLLWCNDPSPGPRFSVAGPSRLAAVDRLPPPALAGGLAATSPAGALAAIGLDAAGGSWWLVTLAEPTSQPFTVTIDCEPGRFVPPAAWAGCVGGVWPWPLLGPTAAESSAPLWTAPAAAHQEHLLAVADPRVLARESHGRSAGRVASVNYQHQPSRIDVAVASGTPDVAVKRQSTVAMLPDGRLICCCDHQFDRWEGGGFAFPLPPEARWLGAITGGTVLAAEEEAEAGRATIDVPVGDNIQFRAFFTLPDPGQSPAAKLGPVFDPQDPHSADGRVTWTLPRGMVALQGQRTDPPSIDWPVAVLPARSAVVTAEPVLFVAQTWPVRLWTGVLTVAALALMLCWRRLAGRPIILFAAVWAIAAVWLPGPLRPLAVGPLIIAVLATAYMVVRPRFLWRPAVALSGLLMLVWSAVGAERAPTTVYILPAIGESADAVLVPRTFLHELDRAMRRGSPDVGAATVSAEYQAEAVGDSLRVAARWQVQALRPGGVWEWPTRGLQVADFRVDGRPALPNIADNRCRFTLPSAGRFAIEAKFTVAVTGGPDEHNVRIPVPPSPAARLTFTPPDGATLLETPGDGATSVGDTVDVDCGFVHDLNLRWREGPARLTPPAVQQAWLWDLAPPSPRLFCVVKADLSPNTTRELTWRIPADLTVASVRTAREGDLADWGQSGDQWTIRLSPAARGTTVLAAELVALEPLVPAQPLPFPTFEGKGSTVLAWHGDYQPAAVNGVEPTPVDALIRDFLVPAKFVGPTPSQAYRKLNPRGVVRVTPVDADWRGTQSFAWRLRSRHADLTATATLTARQPGGLAVWEMPPALTVEEVSGEGVRYWSKTGSRLQVWWDAPRRTAEITWRATVNRSSPTARFDVPVIRLSQSDMTTTLTVDPGPGWDVTPVALTRASRIAGPEPAYRADKPNYRLVVQPAPWAKNAAVRLTTDLTIANDVATAHTTVAVSAANGPARRFGLSLPATAGVDVNIEGGGGHVRELPGELGKRRWIVDPPATPDEPYQLTVASKSKVAGLSAWTVPLAVVDLGGLKPTAWEHLLHVRAGGWEVDWSENVRQDAPETVRLADENTSVRLQPVSAPRAALAEQVVADVKEPSQSPLQRIAFDSAMQWAATLLVLSLIGPIINWLPGEANNSLDAAA